MCTEKPYVQNIHNSTCEASVRTIRQIKEKPVGSNYCKVSFLILQINSYTSFERTMLY